MNIDKRCRTRGFSLLELVIVIIIVGILASLALPRYSSLIEVTRAAEALNNLKAIRGAVTRQYLFKQSYVGGCMMTSYLAQNNLYNCLGLDNLDDAPGAHFQYHLEIVDPTAFTLTAYRNTLDGGDGTSKVYLYETSAEVKICADGVYSPNIQPCS